MTSATPGGYEGQARPEIHLWERIHVILHHRRLVLAVLLGVTAIAVVRWLVTRPVYEATAQILIERDTPSVLSFKEVVQLDAAQDDYYQTQYKLLQSRALAKRVIEALNLLQDPEYEGPRSAAEVDAIRGAPPGTSRVMEDATSRFLEQLQVAPIRNSRLVTVSYAAYRPELAAAVANKLSQLYIEQTLEFRYQTSSEAAHWLGQQIEQQKTRVEEAERALQSVKQQEGIVNIEERRKLLDQKLKELGTAVTSLRTRRLEREALYNQMRAASNPEELPDVMRSPLIQSLRAELASFERRGDPSGEAAKIRRQIQEETQRVIRAAENDYKAAAAQEASMASALETAKAEALDLSRRSVQYDTAKRDVDAGKEVLYSLLSRHKQTDVAQALQNTNIRIVDPASIPATPVRPRKVRDTLIGLAVGLVLGIGLAFLVDYFDNTVKTPDDVRRYIGAPLLGLIPEVAEGSVILTGATSNHLSEGYRVLRTALTYCWPDRAPRVLLITSTSAGEGKTVTSINLALVLASLRGKVLLIDCDLRKPEDHEPLKMKKSPGLSDLLLGETKVSEAIQRSPDIPISFLAAGTRAPSPADLLTIQTMKALLENLRDAYDWIVLDTPPVGPVAEAMILASLADGVIVVVGGNMVPVNAVRHTLERVAETGARILGVVLNRARIERHSSYYERYYGSYYGTYYGSYYGDQPQGSARSEVVDIAAKGPADNSVRWDARRG